MYGILISLGIFIAGSFAEKIIKEDNPKGKTKHIKRKVNHLWGLMLITIIFGIIGARTYYILKYLPYYLENPIQIPQIWKGGLGIFGGIFGGLIAILIYTKKNKLNILYWLDLTALVTPLGQSIARWGNFFNQELFGLPTTLPWGISIPVQKRPQLYLDLNKFHPLFLYESVLNLLLFLLLNSLRKRRFKNLGSGFFTFSYLIGYSTIRFFIEFIKIDTWKMGPINVAQGISVILIIISTLYLSGVLKFKHDDIYSK